MTVRPVDAATRRAPAVVGPEARDPEVARAGREGRPQERVRPEAGVEGDAEQAALALVAHPVPDVEVAAVEEPALAEDPDGALLLDDEEPPAAVARRGDLGRLGEPCGDPVPGDRDGGLGRRSRARDDRGPEEDGAQRPDDGPAPSSRHADQAMPGRPTRAVGHALAKNASAPALAAAAAVLPGAPC